MASRLNGGKYVESRTHFKKWWNCLTVQWDHLKPLDVCRRSLMMKPSSQRHLRAPGPPR